MEKNTKLYPIYRLFSYDALFYYAISILYLTQVKHLDLSQIALISSVYAFSSIIVQIPAAAIENKLGLRTTMIVGNIFCMVYLIIYIVAPSYGFILLAEVFCALGFALKGVSETPFLYSSLKSLNKTSEFSKLEGKGSSYYYFVEAIASIVAGYIYTINSYLPLIFASFCFLISTILAFNMQAISKNKSNETMSPSLRFKEAIDGFRYIVKSKRLNALLLFVCVFYGTISISSIYIKAFLNDITVPSNIFGYIFAIASLAASIGARVQGKIEKKYRNKTLSSFSISFITSFIIIGVCAILFDNFYVLLAVGIIVFVVQSFIKGAYFVTIKEYVSRYTTSSIRPKIMSIYNLASHMGTTIFSLIASATINLVAIGISYSMSGLILFIIIILILMYMSTRVGLDPNTYTKRDRFDLE